MRLTNPAIQQRVAAWTGAVDFLEVRRLGLLHCCAAVQSQPTAEGRWAVGAAALLCSRSQLQTWGHGRLCCCAAVQSQSRADLLGAEWLTDIRLQAGIAGARDSCQPIPVCEPACEASSPSTPARCSWPASRRTSRGRTWRCPPRR